MRVHKVQQNPIGQHGSAGAGLAAQLDQTAGAGEKSTANQRVEAVCMHTNGNDILATAIISEILPLLTSGHDERVNQT